MLSEKDIRNNLEEIRKMTKALGEKHEALGNYLHEFEVQCENVRYAFEKYFDRQMMSHLDDHSRIDELMKNGTVTFNERQYDLDTIKQIAVLKQKYPHHNDAKALYVQYQEIPRLIKSSEIMFKNGISYLLANMVEKSEGVDAINELSGILKQDYLQKANIAMQEMDNIDVLNDYKKNYDWYFEVLYRLTNKRIKREDDLEYQSPAAFNEIIDCLKAVEKRKQETGQAVKEVVDRIVNALTSIALKDVDIEEINADKSGFKVSLLKNNGINTIAEVLKKTKRGGLSYIQGISDEESRRIHDKALAIGKMYAKNITIRIDESERNDLTNSLIKTVHDYRLAKEKENAIKSLSVTDISHLLSSVDELRPLASKCDWFIASHKDKKKALAVYEELAANRELARVKELSLDDKEADIEECWADYHDNAASYYALLEEMAPGVFSKEEGRYGLPAELAKEVADTQVNLGQLKATLRPYQEYGVKYVMKQKRVLLGDEMGLGKTVQAIASMVSLAHNGANHFLVVAPASVLINWCKETEKFSNLRAIPLHGSHRDDNYQDWLNNGGVAVTTFETLSKFEIPSSLRIDMLVVDEAHYVKNRNAIRSKTVLSLKDQCEYILFMTGTALENNVDEMLSLIDALKPEIANDARRMTSLRKAQQFRDVVAGVYFRRRREDVLQELPDLIESDQWCEMTTNEKKKYQSSVLDRSFMAMRQVSFDVDDINDSSKANRLLELCDQAKEEGRKVIVFSFFSNTLAKVREMLGDRATETINGSLPPIKRQEIIDEFSKAEAGKVLVSQIQAGGTGLNIQAASVVIFCEPQVKPSLETQAISRAYRLGQTRSVLVYRLLCEDSVDKKMLERLDEKQQLFDNFADESVAGKKSLEIDNDDMQNIIDEEISNIKKEELEEKNGSL
ncbi:MAG: DEAD/DEAH box helicase [Erysipelotrichaceae bacterium]|nr:DEAD/DEAH box helicase [Erysipelotrichaceae bacterium]